VRVAVDRLQDRIGGDPRRPAVDLPQLLDQLIGEAAAAHHVRDPLAGEEHAAQIVALVDAALRLLRQEATDLVRHARAHRRFAEPGVTRVHFDLVIRLAVFLLLLGIGESPKVWLIVVGTVFFNILMIADAARAVPRELINAAYTLGAGRATVVRRVVFKHTTPGIVDAARVNLAAAWLMLVVAELLAADEGLAFQIVRAQRFRAVDTMFALLIVFGIIGLASDLFLRWLRNRVAPWARA